MKVKIKKARKIFSVVLLAFLLVSVLSFSVGAVETDVEGIYVFSDPVYSIQSYEQWNDDGANSTVYIGDLGLNQYTLFLNIYHLFQSTSELRHMDYDLQQVDSTGSHNILITGDVVGDYREIAIYRDNVEYLVLNTDNITTGILLIPFNCFPAFPTSFSARPNSIPSVKPKSYENSVPEI